MKTNHYRFVRLTAAAVALPFFLFQAGAAAGVPLSNDATWLPAPGSADWNTGGNWDTEIAPNSSTDTATFGKSSVTTITLSTDTTVDRITFGSGADAYTISTNGHNLTFDGAGIINNSGKVQTIINGGTLIDPIITFNGSSSAGNVTIVNDGSGNGVEFYGTSSAGTAKIINNETDTYVYFGDSESGNPTAGNSTILNVGDNSHVTFANYASGGKATIINVNPTSYIDISGLTGNGISLGAIAGGGTVYLGSKNLTVGGNNMSTTFSGVISDGSPDFFKPTFLFFSESEIIPATGGSLTKEGTGTLNLTGANTYTGNTIVNGGTLLVNGSIASPMTFVNAGTLGGSGVIGGSVINTGGVVSPGNSPGTLRVNGNYTQGANGALLIQLASSSVYDRLVIGGAAYLGGTLVVELDGLKAKKGQTFQFLTAGGGVNGTFSKFEQESTGTILKFKVDYTGDMVLLQTVMGSFGGLDGLTPNEQAVANELDRIANDRRASKLINFLSTQPLGDLAADFDKLAAEEYTSIFTLGTSFDGVQSFNLQQRTDNIRSGSTGFSAAGFHTTGGGPAYSGAFGLAGPSGSKDCKECKDVMAPTAENRWGVFLTGVGEWVGVSDDFNARGYDIQSGGFTLGVDYKVCSHFAVGLMAGYVGSGVDLNDGGRVFVNGGKLGVYATAFGDGLYADVAVTGGYSSYDLRRSALQGTARGDTDGGDLNVLFGTGYDIKMGGFTFGPTASFNYTYVGMGEFTEHGSLAPLHFNSQNQESIRSAFGLKASYDCKIGGVVVKPEVRAAWQHEFGDTDYALDSSFANGAGGTFTVNAPQIGRDSLLVGAGFAIQWNDRCTTYVYYDGELGRTNYDSHAVSGGVRVAF